MSALKDQDPDYGPSDARNEKHQRSYEENARNSTARKITAIIEKEFSEEIDAKEKEILEIQERLHRASKVLHLLRYVIVADFYNRKQCQNSQNGDTKQTQIHPAIKQLIGKAPRFCDNSVGTNSFISNDSSPLHSVSFPPNTVDSTVVKSEHNEDIPQPSRKEKRSNDLDAEAVARPKKIPRYIPPRSGLPEPQCPSRGVRHKVRKRIIIGNISKWIPPEWREDAAGHKWTMYVRGNKENPDIDDFVSKVRFFLHPSYRPNDVVEVTSAPFCLSRRGWGEFPLRVQLHFKSALNKPMDIIHHLKLDRTYTGLQTLGSETLVDIWIYADSRCSNRNVEKVVDQDPKGDEHDSKIKQENNEDSNLASELTNSSLNASFNSIDKASDTLIKQEPVNDIKPSDRNSRNLLLSVELDHDYCGSKFLNGMGGNLTIDHTNSSTEQSFAAESTDVIRNDHRNSDNSRLNVKVAKANTNTLNNLDRSTSKVLPLSCSKIHSNLCPLEITIPPLFEPSKNRHVLVLDNNETIPVDIAVPRGDDHIRNLNNDSAKSKLNLVASRGISLLRKPSGSSEVTIQVENPKEGSAQQTLKLQLSKSILLNVNSDVPVLKIAETRNFYDDWASISEKDGAVDERASRENNRQSKELKLRQKISLGKDKHKLQSRKEFYDEVVKTIEAVEIANVEGALKFIIRRMPIISENALDPDYRRLHPYACGSEEEFFTYNVAKRNACEWSRAKMIRCFMKKKFLPEKLWTIKEIMIWARMHGYTPLCPDFAMRSIKQQKSSADSTIVKRISTYTEPDNFCKWLENYPSRPSEQLYDFNSSESKELEVDVDVVSVALPKGEGKRLNGEEKEECTNSKIAVLELDNKLLPLHDFVCETTRAIGIKLVSEEVVPNVAHCAAGRMVMKAIECLVEDLVRMSFARAWERCSDNGCPKVILLEDVWGALLNREEFDVFTNRGLGSKYRFMATE